MARQTSPGQAEPRFLRNPCHRSQSAGPFLMLPVTDGLTLAADCTRPGRRALQVPRRARGRSLFRKRHVRCCLVRAVLSRCPGRRSPRLDEQGVSGAAEPKSSRRAADQGRQASEGCAQRRQEGSGARAAPACLRVLAQAEKRTDNNEQLESRSAPPFPFGSGLSSPLVVSLALRSRLPFAPSRCNKTATVSLCP